MAKKHQIIRLVLICNFLRLQKKKKTVTIRDQQIRYYIIIKLQFRKSTLFHIRFFYVTF